jgi:hypothetical protein
MSEVRDAAIQTLRREHAEFGFSHIEPAAVLGRVMPFETLDEPARLGSNASSMSATKAALVSGGITHCCLRWGLRMFFLASARLCCR